MHDAIFVALVSSIPIARKAVCFVSVKRKRTILHWLIALAQPGSIDCKPHDSVLALWYILVLNTSKSETRSCENCSSLRSFSSSISMFSNASHSLRGSTFIDHSYSSSSAPPSICLSQSYSGTYAIRIEHHHHHHRNRTYLNLFDGGDMCIAHSLVLLNLANDCRNQIALVKVDQSAFQNVLVALFDEGQVGQVHAEVWRCWWIT
jgi:hypothetical protein